LPDAKQVANGFERNAVGCVHVADPRTSKQSRR
jgi:hypothetical protein